LLSHKQSGDIFVISKNDAVMVCKIIPLNCETYLENKGWSKAAKIGTVAVIFGKVIENGELIEVLVPTDVELLDYKNRVMDLLLILEKTEGREWRHIANDIVLSTCDTF
jgi:hypothetical protein